MFARTIVSFLALLEGMAQASPNPLHCASVDGSRNVEVRFDDGVSISMWNLASVATSLMQTSVTPGRVLWGALPERMFGKYCLHPYGVYAGWNGGFLFTLVVDREASGGGGGHAYEGILVRNEAGTTTAEVMLCNDWYAP